MTRTSVPDGLGEAGRSCWLQTKAYLADHDPARFADALERYCRAVDLSARARAQWMAEGSNLVVEGPNHVQYLNPLVTIWQDADRDASRYGAALCMTPATAEKLHPRRQGRRVSGDSAPKRPEKPPKVRLRVVASMPPKARRNPERV